MSKLLDVSVQPIPLPKDVNPKAPSPLHLEVEHKPGSKFWPYKELKGQHEPVAQPAHTKPITHIMISSLHVTSCLLKQLVSVHAGVLRQLDSMAELLSICIT